MIILKTRRHATTDCGKERKYGDTTISTYPDVHHLSNSIALMLSFAVCVLFDSSLRR